MRCVWRIGTETRSYAADDLSGTGASISGGRWNDIGVAMVYAASSRALACLETFVHLNAGGLPLNRYLIEIDVPDDVWTSAEVVAPANLPVGWDAAPAGLASVSFGTEWTRSLRSALLLVPSVVVPEEQNALINPVHPDAWRIKAHKIRKWLYDPRLERK